MAVSCAVWLRVAVAGDGDTPGDREHVLTVKEAEREGPVADGVDTVTLLLRVPVALLVTVRVWLRVGVGLGLPLTDAEREAEGSVREPVMEEAVRDLVAVPEADQVDVATGVAEVLGLLECVPLAAGEPEAVVDRVREEEAVKVRVGTREGVPVVDGLREQDLLALPETERVGLGEPEEVVVGLGVPVGVTLCDTVRMRLRVGDAVGDRERLGLGERRGLSVALGEAERVVRVREGVGEGVRVPDAVREGDGEREAVCEGVKDAETDAVAEEAECEREAAVAERVTVGARLRLRVAEQVWVGVEDEDSVGSRLPDVDREPEPVRLPDCEGLELDVREPEWEKVVVATGVAVAVRDAEGDADVESVQVACTLRVGLGVGDDVQLCDTDSARDAVEEPVSDCEREGVKLCGDTVTVAKGVALCEKDLDGEAGGVLDTEAVGDRLGLLLEDGEGLQVRLRGGLAVGDAE